MLFQRSENGEVGIDSLKTVRRRHEDLYVWKCDPGKGERSSVTEQLFVIPGNRLLCDSKESTLNDEIQSDDKWRKAEGVKHSRKEGHW